MDFAHDMLRRATAANSQYIADLSSLVGIDSGSYDPEGVSRAADWVAARLAMLGFEVERHSPEPDPLTGAPEYGLSLIHI